MRRRRSEHSQRAIEELVNEEAGLTVFGGIGEAISGAIREIVQTGTLKKLETLRRESSSELAELNNFPRLDPKRVMRVYKKLGISNVTELRSRLENGEIEKVLGSTVAQHIRQGEEWK